LHHHHNCESFWKLCTFFLSFFHNSIFCCHG
jgi:hypothetical protein